MLAASSNPTDQLQRELAAVTDAARTFDQRHGPKATQKLKGDTQRIPRTEPNLEAALYAAPAADTRSEQERMDALRAAGFEGEKARAICYARDLALEGASPIAIASMLRQSGFSSSQASLIARAACIHSRAPEPRPGSVPPPASEAPWGLALIALVGGFMVVLLILALVPARPKTSELPASEAAAVPAPEPPLLHTYVPASIAAFYDRRLVASESLATLTVTNGTEHHAICKLLGRGGQCETEFLVPSRQSYIVRQVTAGQYQLYFTLGDAIISGTDRFLKVAACSRFADPILFLQGRQGTQDIYSTISVTLNPVRDGTAKITGVNAAEFDRL